MRKLSRKEYFKTTLVTLAVLCFFCFFVYQRVWAPAEEQRYAPGTVFGDFAIDGNTTVGTGTEDVVSFYADYLEFHNPTIFDLYTGVTFDADVNPMIFRSASYCDFLNGTTILAPNGTKTAPGVAWDDGGGVRDTGWYNTASKGISVLYASVNDTDVLLLDQGFVTVFSDFICDGSATLGKGTSGNSLLFRGMDSWTNQAGPSSFTWNLDIPTIFDASGQTWGLVANTASMTASLVDFNTGVTDFTVPNADAATEALNLGTANALYLLSADVKSGTVAGASFAGNPKIYTVTFNTAFPDTNYSVSVISEESRNWTFQSKLAGSFVMNSNANLALALNVDWIAMAHNDP